MTKDEGKQLAVMQQQLDDFMKTATPILEALNGPKGWFVQMETRMKTQENRSKMIFAVFGGAWAIALLIIGEMLRNFSQTIAAIKQALAMKP